MKIFCNLFIMKLIINEDNFYVLFALIFVVGNFLFMYNFYYTIMNRFKDHEDHFVIQLC